MVQPTCRMVRNRDAVSVRVKVGYRVKVQMRRTLPLLQLEAIMTCFSPVAVFIGRDIGTGGYRWVQVGTVRCVVQLRIQLRR